MFRAEYDLAAAEDLFDSRRYIDTVFMCHLAIERLLEAGIVEFTGKRAPRSHDLDYLLDLTGLQPDEKMRQFIAELANLSVTTRYPEDIQFALSVFSKERAASLLAETKELFAWTRKQIES